MKPSRIQLDRINAVLNMQFPGLKVHEIFGDLDIVISRKTQRIKEIYGIEGDNKILHFVLRPNDGHFLPTIDGAQKILNSGYQRQRVTVSSDAVPFVKKGKSAFCKHITAVDDGIQPNSQVFLVDDTMNLLAIGTAIQPGYAMLQLKSGVAVKPRKSVD